MVFTIKNIKFKIKNGKKIRRKYLLFFNKKNLMKTDWLFKSPIDLEYKQYILLDYLQKLDKNLNNFKLYPQFQEISLHLANINLIMEKGQYLKINRILKNLDDEILISDLVAIDNPTLTKEESLEVYQICIYSAEKLKEYFNQSKAIWDIVNDTVKIETLQNSKNIESKQGLFFLEYKNKTYLYEFIIKPIKKKFLETKCHIKKICECSKNNFYEKLKEIKNPIIKNLKEEKIHKNLILFKVIHTEQFPFKETLLPTVKRKIMNYMIQSKIIKQTVLDKKLLK